MREDPLIRVGEPALEAIIIRKEFGLVEYQLFVVRAETKSKTLLPVSTFTPLRHGHRQLCGADHQRKGMQQIQYASSPSLESRYESPETLR